MQRRTLLQASLLPLAAAAGVTPGPAFAAYPKKAFKAKKIATALRETVGTADIAESGAIGIEMPAIASDPDLVPVRVRSGFADTESITIVVAANPSPLAAHYRLHGPQASVTTRVRMQDSGEVLVVVKAGGKLHSRRQAVSVGRQGCAS